MILREFGLNPSENNPVHVPVRGRFGRASGGHPPDVGPRDESRGRRRNGPALIHSRERPGVKYLQAAANRGSLFILRTNRLIDLLAVDRDAGGGGDADAHLVPSDVDDRQFDVVTDHDRFITLSREHQHVLNPSMDTRRAPLRGTGYLNEGQRIAESTLTAIMGREAAYTGKVITFEEALNSEQDLMPEIMEFAEMTNPPVPVPGKTRMNRSDDARRGEG